MIGDRPSHFAVADGWGSALCMKIANPVSWWIPTKISSTATAVGAAGDVIRFAELYHHVKFQEALALLRQWRGVGHSLLHDAERFYRIQLHRHNEAIAYLHQRGIRSLSTIELMRIGYAPGGCLRGWLTQLVHSLPVLR